MAGVLDEVANRLAREYLTPYTERIRSTGLLRLGPKQVHDTLWGTISLRPVEVAVLDSPLLQRLRHLRQLGVAHWLYPGADHSRFEHSLGVVYQSQQLISAINRAGINKYNQLVISEDDQQLIRMAALLHDTGHPVLSHVSEYALRLDPKILLEVQRERKAVGEKVSISELVSAKIIRSGAFIEFLKVVASEHSRMNLPTTAWASDPVTFVDRVAKVILGQNVSSSVPLLHEIVSGPYDGDKLDYMIRDSRAAGIPAIIDISRLVQKLTVVRYSNRDLPQSVAKLVPQTTREAYIFGFPWSGLSVIDELLLARMMLYSKLYRHPKVAGLESIVQSFLDQISTLVGPAKVVQFVYSILDDQLILATEADLAARLELKEESLKEPERARALEIAVDLLRRLRERELFVRAFAFFPGHPESEGESQSEIFDRIVKHIGDEGRREALRVRIVDETRKILETLDGNANSSPLYKNADQLIVLRILQPPSQKELRHAWIFPTGGAPRTYEKMSIHKEAWSSSFFSSSAKAYLFCPKELAQAAFLAAEAVIAEQFEIATPEWMMEEAKQSRSNLQQAKLSLRNSGYYKTKPKIIRPRWPRLEMSDVENAVTDFADRFSSVQEAVAPALQTDEALHGASTMKKRAYDWLDQFESDADIDCALRLLEKARLVARPDIVGAVRAFISENPTYRSASVIALSKGNDSSQIVQYFAADVGDALKFYGSLGDAAAEGRDEPVLILDDFCGSGNQWGNLIGSLFGDADLKRPELNEQRSLALEPERDYLRNRKVGFVFTAGWKAGADHILKAAKKVGLDARVHVHLDETQLPFADTILKKGDTAEFAEEFLTRAGVIGEELLRATEPDWPPQKVAERRLGYGNRGMLLFFPYNAPSQTLTCMWAGGVVGGEQWEPLVRRRKKT